MPTSSSKPYRVDLLPPPGSSIQHARQPPSSSSPVPALFYDALALRWEVFIKEQNCNPDEDIDADDARSWHWVLFASFREDQRKQDTPAATIRLVPVSIHDHGHDVKHGGEAVTNEGGEQTATKPDYGNSNSGMWDGQEGYAMIGRLATLSAYRGKGFGKILVEQSLCWAGSHPRELEGETGMHWKGLVLAHAQVRVAGWYESMGWVRDDGMGRWWEEGIEHVGIWKRVSIEGQ